jgi:hypothetical protein
MMGRSGGKEKRKRIFLFFFYDGHVGYHMYRNWRKNDLEGKNQHIQERKEELGVEQSTRRKD